MTRRGFRQPDEMEYKADGKVCGLYLTAIKLSCRNRWKKTIKTGCAVYKTSSRLSIYYLLNPTSVKPLSNPWPGDPSTRWPVDPSQDADVTTRKVLVQVGVPGLDEVVEPFLRQDRAESLLSTSHLLRRCPGLYWTYTRLVVAAMKHFDTPQTHPQRQVSELYNTACIYLFI